MNPVATPLATIALCMWRSTAAARKGDPSARALLHDMCDQPLLPERFRRAASNNLASAVFFGRRGAEVITAHKAMVQAPCDCGEIA